MPYWVKPTGISAAGGYVIEGSAYGDGSSGYQSVAGSGSPTDDQNVTIEFWVKRHKLGTAQTIFDAYLSSNNYVSVSFDANDKLDVHLYGGGSTLLRLVTTRVYRDVAAFVHIAVTLDLDNGTQADRCQVRTNGTRETAFDTSTLPANTTTVHYVGYSGATHYIGRNGGGSNYFHDSISRIIVQDGQTTPVGPTDNGDGTISVADPTATIVPGNDGFWFEGGDLADATATDRSSASNNFTKTGTITATNDSPTDDAANGYGNRATLNPLSQGGGSVCTGRVFSNGNREYQAPNTATEGDHTRATMTMPFPNDKLTYIEFRVGTNSTTQGAGVCSIDTDHNTTVGFGTNDIGAYDSSTQTRIYKDGVIVGSAFTPRIDTASTDLVCIAYNGSDGKVWIGTSDGTTRTWRDSSGTGRTSDEPGSGTNPTATLDTGIQWFAYAAAYDQGTMDALVDADDWVHTAPSGAVELSTENLPTPAITDTSAYFKAVTYTTTGSDGLQVTGFTDAEGNDVTPDFVWQKNRDQTDRHLIYDVLRGAGNRLSSNLTQAEASESDTLKTFDAGGVTLGNDATNALGINHTASESCIMWMLKAGGAGSANTDGSISSTVSVADHNGFAIINSNVGATSSGTIGHGMGQAPEMIIGKPRDNTYSWGVYHKDIGETKALFLESTSAAIPRAMWNNTAPTSSVFSFGNSDWINNCIFYAFARTSGLIGIGSYTGNGDADGPYVVVDDGASGFKPAFVLIKNIDDSQDWVMFDNARDPYNVVDANLSPNLPNEEDAGTSLDFTANGFKPRAVSDINNSSKTYIYLALAEYPFGGDGVEQARAR